MRLDVLLLFSTALGLARAAIFTNTHFVGITAGQPFDTTFTKADGPVTIELMSGDMYDLKLIQTLATDVSGEHFSWVPTGELCVNYYSLRITDKSGIPNYSASFPLTLDHKFTADGDCSQGAVSPATMAALALALRDDMEISTGLMPSTTMLFQTKTLLRDGTTSINTRAIFVPATATRTHARPDEMSNTKNENVSASTQVALPNDGHELALASGGVMGFALGIGLFGLLA
ncbi:hypothetical protein BP5796_11815 [Coleophoma crateriformis]|uniref:Yeast cell wall synthesis Kre9/Knh1-like N-terminal domain-containing protein n=1 Tax=Coleophoma crateriformis TaxID=565419 RepID=A0A3D8QEG5_9HELO|nr:hypothetical protein BP5796_11815 [Coleophoma crateriformis]